MKQATIILFTFVLLIFSISSCFAYSDPHNEKKINGGVSGGGKIENEQFVTEKFSLIFRYHLPEVKERELESVLLHFSYREKKEILQVVQKAHMFERRAILIQQIYR